MSKKRNRPHNTWRPGSAGQFVSHAIEMIRSPAWRSLSLTARRILDRLEIEHARHGGRENGRLVCLWEDFEKFGCRRASIGAALQELVDGGFTEITQEGRPAYADLRIPSAYRLTYLPTYRGAEPMSPTNDWKTKNWERNGTGTGSETEPVTPKKPVPKRNQIAQKPVPKRHHHLESREEGVGAQWAVEPAGAPALPRGDGVAPVPPLQGTGSGGLASAPPHGAVASEPAANNLGRHDGIKPMRRVEFAPAAKPRADRGRLEVEIANVIGWERLHALSDYDIAVLCDRWADGTITAEMLAGAALHRRWVWQQATR